MFLCIESLREKESDSSSLFEHLKGVKKNLSGYKSLISDVDTKNVISLTA